MRPATAQVVAPFVDSICPSSPQALFGNQTVEVKGVNFAANLTVTVTFPNGGTGTLSGSQVIFFSSTSFAMLINFNGNPGVYRIRVNNPNGAMSNQFSFQVFSSAQKPRILSIVPTSPAGIAGFQNIQVNGDNLRSNSTVSVTRGGAAVPAQVGVSFGCTGLTMQVDFQGVGGNYVLTVRNPDSGLVSDPFPFVVTSVCNPPTISAQPVDQTINSGQQAGLVVSASGTTPLSFQWYLGSSGNTANPIGGATSASFTTPPLTVTTTYWVGISNSCGNVASRTVTVNVTPTCTVPSITAQPVDQTISSGQQAGLVVTASGTPTLSYQWYQGASGDTSHPIAGATSATFTTPVLTGTTTYWVRISNSCGSVNSRTVTVNVTTCVLPTITTQPVGKTISSGQTATLTVVASGTAPLRYQWYKGLRGDISNPISGATSSSFTTPPLTATTSYWVYVENNCGHDDSVTATITVAPATQFCLSTSVSPSGAGSITRSQTGPCYNSGATVQLTATAAAGFVFDHWSGDVLGNSNPVTVTMNANKNIVANFLVPQMSLSGMIGIGDGQLFWPLDGSAVVGLTVRATPVQGGSTRTATVAKPNYSFGNMPAGSYNLQVILTYREQITVNNQTSCRGVLGGCTNSLLQKSVTLNAPNVSVPRTTAYDIAFPSPLVMVHGTRSCFGKWYGFQSDPQANEFWDNAARNQGFISLTPNYHSEAQVRSHWENALAELRQQIEADFVSLTHSANAQQYPGWVFIGHSQGGLFARVLMSGQNSNSALAASLRKIYLLGTPNSGALSDVGADLLCSHLLSPTSMQVDFNNAYPNFGGKDVMVFAGTHHCNLITHNCSPTPADDDSVVPVEFVHVIYQKRCGGLICPPVAVLRLTGPDFFYTHEELGSSASRRTILENRILVQVRALSQMASVPPSVTTLIREASTR